MSEFGNWRVRVEQATSRCWAYNGKRAKNARCTRTGHYGWGAAIYCYIHHPCWSRWAKEATRLQRIAQDAVTAALAREAARQAR